MATTERLPPQNTALAALKALADAFMQGVDRPADEATRPLGGARPQEAAVIVLDEQQRVQHFDAVAEALWDRAARELDGQPVESLLTPLPDPGESDAAVARRADGTEVPVTVSHRQLKIGPRTISILLVQGAHAVRDQLPSELRYRNLIEQIPAVVFTAALEGGLSDLYVGPQIQALLGYTQEEWLRSPVLWYERLHPDDRRALDQEFARGCATGGPFKAECRFMARDGRIVWVHGEARLIKDRAGWPLLLQGVAFDISETKRAEEVIRASLREKELLLKEIHHRVKNNLQITSSLLHLQIAKVADQQVRDILRDSQDRIRSMALVHEMLYKSPDLSRVDFGEYVKTLILQLFRSYTVDQQRVSYRLGVQDIVLGVDIAMPCGLIVHELVANALKHAFPDRRAGTIEVSFTKEASVYRLAVRDNGVGVPPGLDVRRTDTLGLQLVITLIKQLDGELQLRTDGQTEFVVTIPRVAA